METQMKMLLSYLMKHKTITGLVALQELGVISYTKCISKLRAIGVIIRTEFLVKRSRFGKKRFAKYTLIRVPKKVLKANFSETNGK